MLSMPWGFTGLVVVVPAVGRFFEREESEEGIGIVAILIRGVLQRTGTAMIFSYKGYGDVGFHRRYVGFD